MEPILSGVIIGVVEGLTEFLPISSTGHMILVGHWIGFTGEKAESFEIFIQLGAILAVAVLYYKRFLALLPFANSANSGPLLSGGLRGYAGLSKMAVACAPAFALGFLFHKKIKEMLFAPFPVAVALILGGIVLVLIERRKTPPVTTTLDEITFTQAFLVGIFQSIALWPGVSRSGSMIVGGLLSGMNRIAAAEFSFLVAVPIMAAATAYDLLKSYKALSMDDLPLFLTGFAIAFITAIIAIRFFLGLLKRFSLAPFGWYRIALGTLVLILLRS